MCGGKTLNYLENHGKNGKILKNMLENLENHKVKILEEHLENGRKRSGRLVETKNTLSTSGGTGGNMCFFNIEYCLNVTHQMNDKTTPMSFGMLSLIF